MDNTLAEDMVTVVVDIEDCQPFAAATKDTVAVADKVLRRMESLSSLRVA